MLSRFFTTIILAVLKFYRLAISPLLGVNCRFEPSCSNYATEAIQTHGILKGSRLTLVRVAKCHPFNSNHGYDPVPPYNRKKNG